MEKNSDTYKTCKINPPAAFNAVISHFYSAINNSDSSLTKILSPSFQTLLIFNLSDNYLNVQSGNNSLEIKKWMVLGPLKKAITYTVPPHGEFFVVNFKDDSFYRFFENAIITPTSKNTIHSENISYFDSIWHQLREVKNINEYSKCILDIAQQYLKEDDPVLKKIIKYKEDGVEDFIKQVAEEKSISERYVQKKHKKHFGYSAKEIGRHKRFSQTLNFIEKKNNAQNSIDWFDVIVEFGYYDQSHLIHEFNHFLNCTPQSYLAFQKDICIIKTE